MEHPFLNSSQGYQRTVAQNAAEESFMKQVQHKTMGICLTPASLGSWGSTGDGWTWASWFFCSPWSLLTHLQCTCSSACLSATQLSSTELNEMAQMQTYKTSWGQLRVIPHGPIDQPHPMGPLQCQQMEKLPWPLLWEEIQSHMAKVVDRRGWRIHSDTSSSHTWVGSLLSFSSWFICASWWGWSHPKVAHNQGQLLCFSAFVFLNLCGLCVYYLCSSPSLELKLHKPPIRIWNCARSTLILALCNGGQV
jgi:hypothetical protein